MDPERPDVGRPPATVCGVDPWARVEPLVLGLMLQCNWTGDAAERLAFELVYWELHGDRAQDAP